MREGTSGASAEAGAPSGRESRHPPWRGLGYYEDFVAASISMLKHLARPEVAEFAIMSGRLPCVKIGSTYQPVSATPLATDDVLELLANLGGNAHLDRLGHDPVKWTSRVAKVGVVTVAAVKRDRGVQVRLVLLEREESPGSTKSREGADASEIAAGSQVYAGRSDAPRPQPAHRARTRGTLPPETPPPAAPSRASRRSPPLRTGPNRNSLPAEVSSLRPPGTPGARPRATDVSQSPKHQFYASERPPGIEMPSAPPSAASPAYLASSMVSRSLSLSPAAAKGPENPAGKRPSPELPPLRASSPPSLSPPSSAAVAKGQATRLEGMAAKRGAVRLPPLPTTPPPPIGPAVSAREKEVLPSKSKGSEVKIRPSSFEASGRPLVSLRPEAPSVSLSPTEIRAGPQYRLPGLLSTARSLNASDLHLVAGRPPLLRIAGELQPMGGPWLPQELEALAEPLVPPRCRPPLEKEGSCDFAVSLPELGRFRINVARQSTGLKLCIRLVSVTIPTLASLGLPPEIAKATEHHQGLIVVTGPTGHGKTSTLAAIIDILNSQTSHHIITVEDPIEYIHSQKRAVISQREVGTHTKSFANALKAALRQDPDVIMVGELRDSETVRMALSASETGHLVLGTMNTPSAAKTIDRIIDFFPPADQQQVRLTLAGGLRLIVSQRLLPCVDAAAMVAAVELLPGSVPLFSLIRDNKTYQIPSLQQRGRAIGIIRLDDSLAELVRQGRANRESALAVAEQPEELESVLAGLPGKTAADQVPPGGTLVKPGQLGGVKLKG